MGDSIASPRKVLAREREVRALSLREAGAKYAKIAEALGYRSISAAQRAVVRALEKLGPGPEAERLRELEVSRLDALQVRLWSEALNGNLSAVDRVLRIMERRARLLGLDAPALHKLSGDKDAPVQIRGERYEHQLSPEQAVSIVETLREICLRQARGELAGGDGKVMRDALEGNG